MAQFIPFSPNVEVSGKSINVFLDGLPNPESKKRVAEYLQKNGVDHVNPDHWYKQELVLNTWKYVGELLGPASLFQLGKTIPEKAAFPPEVNSLDKGLASIDMAYKMFHRGGNIGYYKVVAFDAAKRSAVMECKTPYPSEGDRGLIMTMLRRFKPKDSIKYDVVLDTTKPTRLNGADSCTYKINW